MDTGQFCLRNSPLKMMEISSLVSDVGHSPPPLHSPPLSQPPPHEDRLERLQVSLLHPRAGGDVHQLV